jgi:ferritin-like metal-binding protein YciE
MFNLGIVDEEEEIMKFQEGDTIVDQGIIYAVEKMEDGHYYGDIVITLK